MLGIMKNYGFRRREQGACILGRHRMAGEEQCPSPETLAEEKMTAMRRMHLALGVESIR